MKFPTPLVSGTLIKRYRRSLVDVKREDGSTVTAHCTNVTPMLGCYHPGNRVILSDSGNPARRHRLTWELIEIGGTWVCVNTAVARKVVFEALQEKAIPSLAQYHEVDQEGTYGISGKVDLILHGMEQNCFMNVYPVTWVENGLALYPDYRSERATASLLKLAEIVRDGHSAAAFFLVQRGDCTSFKPAEKIDRALLKALLKLESVGAEILVYRAAVTSEEITIGDPLPHSLV
jgi:sugar fermentation stimulation protein A